MSFISLPTSYLWDEITSESSNLPSLTEHFINIQGHIAVDGEDFGAILEEYIAEESERRNQLGITVSSASKNSMGKSDNNTCRIDRSSDNGDDSGTRWNEIEDEIEGKDDDKEEERGDTESDSGDEDYMPDYLKPKEKLQWDCETIISTYSNLDNHPVQLVSATGPRGKTSSSIANDSGRQEPKRITLSQKSGLPLGVLPTKQSTAGAEGTISRENKGAARNKKETREEKKIRKMRVKEERQEKRKTKSQLKMAFKNDELEQQKRVAHQKLGGVSTFKI